MTDYAPNKTLGEMGPDTILRAGARVNVDGVKKGDALTVVGRYDDDFDLVVKQTGSKKARYIAGEDGDKDDLIQVIEIGPVKMLAGGAIPIDSDITINDNKVIVLSGVLPKQGRIQCSAAAADGDHVRIMFNGGLA